MDRTRLILLRTALGPAIGGTVYLVARYLPPAPYWDGVFRALPAGLLLLAVRPAIPRGIWWWRAFVVGTLNIGVFFGLLFVSAQRLPAGVAATIGATSTLVAIGFASGVLGERVRAIQYLAAITGILGVALLVLRGSSGVDVVGVVAGLGSAVSLGLGLVFSRKWGRPAGVHSLTFAGWTLIAGALILMPVAVLADGRLPHVTLPQFAGLAWVSLVGAGLAYALLLIGVQQLPVGLTAPLPLINPVTAALSGWVIAGQTLSVAQLLGGVLVLVSVLVGSRPPRRAVVAHGPPADSAQAAPASPNLGRT